jgi:hypothetical protein
MGLAGVVCTMGGVVRADGTDVTVKIDSKPEHANIYVDGDLDGAWGQTPSRLPLSPGPHTITLELEGYAEQTLKINVHMATSFTAQLQAVAGANPASTPGGRSSPSPSTAPAADPSYASGAKYFAVGDYKDAIQSFKAGYLANQQPEYLYAIAQSERLSGDCKDAGPEYHQYLQQTQGATDPNVTARQNNAQSMLATCKASPARAKKAGHATIAQAQTVTTNATVSLSRGNPSASYTQVTNCQKNPGDASCQKQTQVSASKAGLDLSVTKTDVSAVSGPRPTDSLNYSLGAGFGFMHASSVWGLMYDGTLAGQYLFGGLFPTRDGGDWSGVALRPSLSLGFSNMFTGVGGSNLSGFAFTLNPSLGAGYSWLRYGSMNAETLEQDASGVFLGGDVGYQLIKGSFHGDVRGVTINQSYSSKTTTWGPDVGYMSVDYNPATAHVTYSSIDLFIMPTSSFFLMLNITKGY